MSLDEYVDKDDLASGVITLTYRYPVCPHCGGKRPFKERFFLLHWGMCQQCFFGSFDITI